MIDELDQQKYGPRDSDLARKAAKAMRYLERVLRTSPSGHRWNCAKTPRCPCRRII